MYDTTRVASIFIMLLGIMFILAGLIFTVLFDLPAVLGVAMVIVGIFISLLPLTRDRYR